MSDTNFENYEQDALEKPRDKAWENWAKFDEIGDKVQGYIRDVFFKEGDGQSDQRVLTLEQPDKDKTLINVGIKHLDFILNKTDNLRLGDPVTIVFEKELPPKVKTHSPTKQFGFYGKNLDANASEKTVAELEAEDRKLAEEESAKQDADFDNIGNDDAPKKGNDDLPFESGEGAEAPAEETPKG